MRRTWTVRPNNPLTKCLLSHSHSELILLQCCCCSNPHTADRHARWLQDMHSGVCQAVEPWHGAGKPLFVMPACRVLTLHTELLRGCSLTLQRRAWVRLTVLMPCLCASNPTPDSSTAVWSTATASAGRRLHARQAGLTAAADWCMCAEGVQLEAASKRLATLSQSISLSQKVVM